MPVIDHPVHEKTRKTRVEASCHNNKHFADGYYAPDRIYNDDGTWTNVQAWQEHRMTKECQQIGDLAECNGCEHMKGQ